MKDVSVSQEDRNFEPCKMRVFAMSLVFLPIKKKIPISLWGKWKLTHRSHKGAAREPRSHPSHYFPLFLSSRDTLPVFHNLVVQLFLWLYKIVQVPSNKFPLLTQSWLWMGIWLLVFKNANHMYILGTSKTNTNKANDILKKEWFATISMIIVIPNLLP